MENCGLEVALSGRIIRILLLQLRAESVRFRALLAPLTATGALVLLLAGCSGGGGLLGSAPQPAPSPPAPLGSYSISSGHIFVAGISSGGFMAVQMDVAYSKLFKGAAIYAGGPYYCAQGSVSMALGSCSTDSPPINLPALESDTVTWATEGLIDPTVNLAGQTVYLWSGLLDTTVQQPVMNALESYYEYFGANVFQYDNGFNAAHGWESPYGPVACGVQASPFVILCHYSDEPSPPGPPGEVYDSQQVWLTQWLGTLNPKNEGTLSGSVLPFNQNPFSPSGVAADIGLASTGYVFVPRACAEGQPCSLILALHGCSQYYGAIGSAFIDDSGINQWADTNNIVVLYPQIAPSTVNPLGCWNWWGYLGDANYAQQNGPQMKALYQMVARAAGL